MIQSIKDFFIKVGSYINLVLIIAIGILGTLLYSEEKKNEVNKELIKNDEIKNKVERLNASTAVDTESLVAEEEKRKALEKQLKKDSDATLSNDELAHMLNDVSNNDK